jgi:hypothetical protein
MIWDKGSWTAHVNGANALVNTQLIQGQQPSTRIGLVSMVFNQMASKGNIKVAIILTC